MTTAPLHHTTHKPDGPVPDVRIYPVGAFRIMPSMAHERARAQTVELLHALVGANDLVASELAVLWDPTDLRQHLLPDIMVALGVGDQDPVYGILRRQYRIWHEGKPPDLIVEYASPSTVKHDSLGKKEDYARMGVREYVQFDPTGETLPQRLTGYRLRRGVYRETPAGADGAVPSLVLAGYEWLREGIHLRLRDRETQLLVPTPEEARLAAEEAHAREAAARAVAETAWAREADARLAAEEARAREAVRAAEAEDKVARLEAEIARLRATPDLPRE